MQQITDYKSLQQAIDRTIDTKGSLCIAGRSGFGEQTMIENSLKAHNIKWDSRYEAIGLPFKDGRRKVRCRARVTRAETGALFEVVLIGPDGKPDTFPANWRNT